MGPEQPVDEGPRSGKICFRSHVVVALVMDGPAPCRTQMGPPVTVGIEAEEANHTTAEGGTHEKKSGG